MTTVREWIAIYSDLDAYIAEGGQLLDLRVGQMEDAPDAVKTLIVEQLGVERLGRLDRFHKRVADAMSGQTKDAQIGAVLNEDQMRAIWQESAVEVHPVVKREYHARMALRKKDLRLQRTPARHWSRAHGMEGYQVIDNRNVVVAGAGQREYEMSLEDVEAFVAGLDSRPH
jgi:hypothetical protein